MKELIEKVEKWGLRESAWYRVYATGGDVKYIKQRPHQVKANLNNGISMFYGVKNGRNSVLQFSIRIAIDFDVLNSNIVLVSSSIANAPFERIYTYDLKEGKCT